MAGPDAVADALDEPANADAREATVDFVLVLVAVFLLAYVRYGTRTAVHSIYQGILPRPLDVVARPGLALAKWHRDRLHRRLMQREDEQNVPLWITVDTAFEEAFSEEPLDPAGAPELLASARRRHAATVKHMDAGEPWAEQEYAEAVGDLHRLQANDDWLDADVRAELVQAVHEVEGAFRRLRPPSACSQTPGGKGASGLDPLLRRLLLELPHRRGTGSAHANGNLMSALECYMLERYAIGLGTLWPRISHVLSDSAQVRIDERNTYLDFTVAMSLLALLTAAVAVGAAIGGPSRTLGVSIALPVVGLMVFWLFYRLGVGAMRSYLAELQAAVDLHRLKLLDALGIEPPATPAEEMKPLGATARVRGPWRPTFMAPAHLPSGGLSPVVIAKTDHQHNFGPLLLARASSGATAVERRFWV